MKVLFTGGSSFTGYWFARQLAAAGHDLCVLFRRELRDYRDELRRWRVEALTKICRPVFGFSFGDDQFVDLVKGSQWDLLCHHGADATDYKSPDFNVIAAVENNAHRLSAVLDALTAAGCTRIVLTGSVFENDEGAGSEPREAFSPYGLSKGITWQMFRYYAQVRRMSLGKFVIPNPFGPWEEPRFTHYLMKNWFARAVPTVNTPAYVRDNIHVSLLAAVYGRFAAALPEGISRVNPSGYIETQVDFAEHVAREMRARLNLKCDFAVKTQTEFAEPKIRVNTDAIDVKSLDWNERTGWDEFANYYARLMGKPTLK